MFNSAISQTGMGIVSAALRFGTTAHMSVTPTVRKSPIHTQCTPSTLRLKRFVRMMLPEM